MGNLVCLDKVHKEKLDQFSVFESHEEIDE